ncbi:MAG: glutamyl-tRNA reductase, partial [Gemmatimonadetes bacterium]|nr:glutamyl-tRNA reductase [Gemmatimonadota bacterium]
AELAAKSLAHFGFGTIWIMNRTPERAGELAARVGGEAVLWEELHAKLGRADAVFACTAATTPLIDVSMIKKIKSDRSHRRGPLFLVDLAVPRNIDPRVRKSDGVFLYDLDDLQSMIEQNQKRRSLAAQEGKTIIDGEALKFDRWLLSLGAGESIRLLRSKWERIHHAELDRMTKNLGPDERERMARFSHNVLKKILHGPTVRLRDVAGMKRNGHPDYEKSLRELFDLVSDEDDS